MPSRIFLYAIYILAGLSTSLSSHLLCAQENWPRWRGPDMNALSPSTNLLQNWNDSQPKLLWQSDGLGEGYASISIVNDQFYTTGNFSVGQAVIAADATDGSELWKQYLTAAPPKHGYVGSRSTPTFDDGHLYVVASDGQIICLNADDGAIIWQKSFEKEFGGKMMSGWGYSESPLVDGNLVLCTPGGSDATVVALNKKTGAEIWRCAVPTKIDDGKNQKGRDLKSGAGYSSIVISNGGGVKQYVQQLGQGIVGIGADDGKYLWGSDAAASHVANIPTPIISGDFVFYSNAYGAGAELLKLTADGDLVSASQVYFLDPKVLQNHHGGMILLDGHVYCGHKQNDGFPVCVELETGEVKWGGKIRGEGDGSAAVLLAEGHLIFRYQNGKVVLIEATPEEYRLKGSFVQVYQEKESWAHPVIVNQKLYLREQRKMMCYDLSSE